MLCGYASHSGNCRSQDRAWRVCGVLRFVLMASALVRGCVFPGMSTTVQQACYSPCVCCVCSVCCCTARALLSGGACAA
eukprot:10374440-Alexandrium_andersonii.AAC.1